MRDHPPHYLRGVRIVSVKEIQRRLAAAGFDPGPVDGVVGGKTLGALDAALRQARPLGGLPAGESVLINAIEPGLALLPDRM
jgi:peptidoglycan hydrolase-like protein with peptidoglycan-binding domain